MTVPDIAVADVTPLLIILSFTVIVPVPLNAAPF
jgi:hypothetical protein